MDWNSIQTSINASAFSALRSESEVIQYLTEAGTEQDSVPAIIFSEGQARDIESGKLISYDLAVTVKTESLDSPPGEGDSFEHNSISYIVNNWELFGDSYTIYGERRERMKFSTNQRLT